MTFSVEGSHKVAQPKTVSRIGWDMLVWAREHAPRNLIADVSEPIAVDGLDIDKLTGTINWYVPPDLRDIEEVLMYIDQFIREELLPLGIRAKPRLGLEKSGMWGKRANVIRVDIWQNGTADFTRLPEMNVHNKGAAILLHVLGLGSGSSQSTPLGLLVHPEPPDGVVGAQELLVRISKAQGAWNEILAGQNEDWSDYVDRSLDELKDIALAAMTTNTKKVVWS